MYESFYGLNEKPFHLLPDPDYIFMSHDHENTFTHLEYAISDNKGFVVITGEIGAGKTTLINFLLTKIQQDIHVGVINNTAVTPSQFVKMICQEFELDVTGMDKVEMLGAFNNFLIEQFASRTRVVLIIDEAQNLPTKTLEEVRMLSNLESEKHHLLQIIMVGQPELKAKIQRRELMQFAQRVTVNCHLRGITADEVGPYIRHRLHVAGSKNGDIFDPGAVEAVYLYSRGIPRLVNILCDTALVYGFADGVKIISREFIENIVREREAAGIFAHVRQSQTDPPEAPRPEAPPPAPMDNSAMVELETLRQRIEVLEERLQAVGEVKSGEPDDRIPLLQNMFDHLDQRIKFLSEMIKKRDKAFAQVFNALKESLESRNHLVAKLIHEEQRMESESIKAPSPLPIPRTSFFSRFKKGAENR
jgi:general secretion pathway protein A